MVAQRICLEDEGVQLLPAATTAVVVPQVTTGAEAVEAAAEVVHLVDLTSTEEDLLEVVGSVEEAAVVVAEDPPVASSRKTFNLRSLLASLAPSSRN